MKRILKSSLSLVLALTIILSSALVGLGEIDFGGIFAVKASAASESDFTFELNQDQKSYSIKKCRESAKNGIVIPSTYNGLPVTSIGNKAFNYCFNLIDLTIPDSIINIGSYAFYDCPILTTVTLGNGIKSIGSYAFTLCKKLTSINVDENNAYYTSDNGILFDKDKTHLIKYPQAKTDTNYTLPDSVTHIENEAFYDCGKLTSVDLPDGLINIGNFAFYRCSSLTDIIIPDSVTSIGDHSFSGCTNLANCTLSKNLNSMGNAAFYGCKNITDITLPDGITEIGEYTFGNCVKLTLIVIPNGVTKIGAGAFYCCSNLKNVTLPDSLKSIENDAFNCCDSITEITLPDGLTKIGNNAFTDCVSLASIIIPDSVTKLGECVFTRCSNLTAAILPDGLKKIPYGLFYCNFNLTVVAIPESVTLIGEQAFYGCKNLQTIIYGGSVDSLGKVVVESGNDSILGAVVYCLKPSTPKLSKIENKTGGVKITWGKTAGAESYNVYRKTYSNGKWSGWSTIKTGATGTSYTDTTAKSGKYYRYTVRAKNEAGLSGYNSAGLKIKFLSTPKLSSISNGSGKVTVKWSKVSGASSYTVYRKTYSNGKWSGWKKVATTKNTSYNDTNVSSGKYYKYTVRATSGDYKGSYNSTGIKIKYLAAPKLSSISSAKNGVTIKWNKITGASGYIVYRKTGNGSYKKLATVKGKSKLSYTDKSAKKGKKYTYKVKAYYDKTYSAYSGTKKITDKY